MRCLAAFVLITGCQCGASPPATPPTMTASESTTPSARTGTAVTPPVKAAPLDATAIARLATLTFPGYSTKLRSDAPTVFEVRHLTIGSPRLAVTVTVKPCFGCLAMQLDAWKQRRDALELLVDERLRDRPETDFEIGATTLSGVPAIYTYQAGQLFGTDRSGNPTGTYTDAYALYFNDGVNEIRVVAEYKDDPAASKAAMVAKAPREQLDRIAHDLGDAYVHAW